MTKIIIQDDRHLVGTQELAPGMTIRRYDEVAMFWFEGEVCSVSSYDYEKQQRISGLFLSVDGFVPSPLQEGDSIEILSEEENERG